MTSLYIVGGSSLLIISIGVFLYWTNSRRKQ